MNRLVFLVFALLATVSCNSDDDICISGEATPRMNMKFKAAENKLLQVDTLYVDVDYGSGARNVLVAVRADSVMLPLRVDANTYTDVYVRRRKAGPQSKIRVNYTTESQYVSPACGIKRAYMDVNYVLEKTDPVTKIEPVQTEIINEEGTHLYLVF